MYYKVEFDFDNFPWWSGAMTTYRRICESACEEQAKSLIEMIFADDENATDTAINDYMWFEIEKDLKDNYDIDIWAE